MVERYDATPQPPNSERFTTDSLDESLVTDTRAGLTPAQFVERKLVALLKSNPLPISHAQLRIDSLRCRPR